MTSLVPYHGSLTFTGLAAILIDLLDQDSYDERVLKPFLSAGLILESVDLVAHKIDGAFVFVLRHLVRDGKRESMASVFAIPSDITQFTYVKLLVDEKAFQVQNETKVVLEHIHG